MPSIPYRVDSIYIGVDDEDYYDWTGILDITFEDTTPWEHIEIPAGPMVHQHIHSAIVKGQIRVVDLGSLYAALYETVIDAYSHTAIGSSPLRKKYKIGYFVVNAYDQNNYPIYITFTNLHIEFVTVESIKVGVDSTMLVHFTADDVSISWE